MHAHHQYAHYYRTIPSSRAPGRNQVFQWSYIIQLVCQAGFDSSLWPLSLEQAAPGTGHLKAKRVISQLVRDHELGNRSWAQISRHAMSDAVDTFEKECLSFFPFEMFDASWAARTILYSVWRHVQRNRARFVKCICSPLLIILITLP